MQRMPDANKRGMENRIGTRHLAATGFSIGVVNVHDFKSANVRESRIFPLAVPEIIHRQTYRLWPSECSTKHERIKAAPPVTGTLPSAIML
jgi:hypothetical protein